MIQHQPVKPAVLAQGKVHDPLPDVVRRQVRGHGLDTAAEFIFELLERRLVAGYRDDVGSVGGLEEVSCDGETQAWM